MPLWIGQTSVQLPRLAIFFEKVPLTFVELWNFTGPLVTVTLWGAWPFHTHLTVVFLPTVNAFGEKRLSLTDTDFVAANAGMASSAVAATTVAAEIIFFIFIP